jgi:DNA-nicking Smr family endonuclease
MKKLPLSYTVSKEDSALFRQTIKNIGTAKKPKRIVPEIELQDHWPETVTAEANLFFAHSNATKPTLRKLKQGKIAQDALLDLHGLNVEQARRALTSFLADAYRHHYQCVRIIHGKSKYLGPKPPILKNHVNGWLQQHPSVIAFCSATLKDGGNGAVYVLLQSH